MEEQALRAIRQQEKHVNQATIAPLVCVWATGVIPLDAAAQTVAPMDAGVATGRANAQLVSLASAMTQTQKPARKNALVLTVLRTFLLRPFVQTKQKRG